ncbi:Sec63 Brl domain-containing protein [Chytridium lagenaria]|nr:Sec63 Brl domain-containing protein [Chytridium lagenaria]
MELSKSLQAKTWEKGGMQLLQVESIGQALAMQLAEKGIKTLESFMATPPEDIERILGRNRLIGNKLLENAAALPKFYLKVSEYAEVNRGDVEYFVNVGISNTKELRVPHKKSYCQVYFIAGTSDNDIVDYRKFPIMKLRDQQSFRFKVKLRSSKTTMTCILAPEEFVGLDATKTVELPVFKRLGGIRQSASKQDAGRQESTGSVDLGIYCKDKTLALISPDKTSKSADDFDFDAMYAESLDAQVLDEIEQSHRRATSRTGAGVSQITPKSDTCETCEGRSERSGVWPCGR